MMAPDIKGENTEVLKLRRLNEQLADRVAAQSELLSKRAESAPLEVWPIGAKVIVDDRQPGTVVCISIRAAGVRYEVGFWAGDAYKEHWFEEFQVAGKGAKRVVGFRSIPERG